MLAAVSERMLHLLLRDCVHVFAHRAVQEPLDRRLALAFDNNMHFKLYWPTHD